MGILVLCTTLVGAHGTIVAITATAGIVVLVVDNQVNYNKKYKSYNNMAQKERIERPAQVIKPVIAPISNEVKTKVSLAFQEVVNAIKNKHLG